MSLDDGQHWKNSIHNTNRFWSEMKQLAKHLEKIRQDTEPVDDDHPAESYQIQAKDILQYTHEHV